MYCQPTSESPSLHETVQCLDIERKLSEVLPVCYPQRKGAQLLQALRMMRGAPAAGPGLQLTTSGAAVAPTPGVHVPQLSPGSLRSLLQRFADAATRALR